MTKSQITNTCLEMLPKRKGFSIVFDAFEEDINSTSFEIRVLRNNQFQSSRRFNIKKATEQNEARELQSKLESFLPLIVNDRFDLL